MGNYSISYLVWFCKSFYEEGCDEGIFKKYFVFDSFYINFKLSLNKYEIIKLLG